MRVFERLFRAALTLTVLLVGVGCSKKPAEGGAAKAEADEKALKAKTAEAIDNLDKIVKSAASYYGTPHVERGTGSLVPCQFPATVSASPATSCCEKAADADGDKRCNVDVNAWTTDTWSALNFSMNDQHYFRYAFTSSGTRGSARFTAFAYADLDCDGVFSTFERSGTGDPNATFAECNMQAPGDFTKTNELE